MVRSTEAQDVLSQRLNQVHGKNPSRWQRE